MNKDKETDRIVNIEYPALSKARDTLNIQWYRSAMEPQRFRELSRRSDLKGWIQAGGHFGLFMITGLFVYLAWAAEFWIIFFIALFIHGTVGSFFTGTAPHELGHGTVFHTKWLNKFFLYLFSLLGWWNPFDYASSHTYHHRYTLHPEGDREVLLPMHPNIEKTFLLQLFTLNLLTTPGRSFGKGGLISTIWMTFLDALGRSGSKNISSNEWLIALHFNQPDQHKRSVVWSRIQLTFHIALVLGSIFTGYWVLPLIFTFFSFISNWLSYFVSLPQHCGLRENLTDFRKSTRSIVLPRFVEFLYWHMNWHTEHHMYAGIPCYNLRELHFEIEDDMPRPRTLLGAWKEMLDTWKLQKLDPNYQYDTPLPPTAKIDRKRKAEVNESSIGDLAPKNLS